MSYIDREANYIMEPCTHPGMKRLVCLIGKKWPQSLRSLGLPSIKCCPESVMDVQMDFHNYCVCFSTPFEHRPLPSATAPAPHDSTRCHRRKNGPEHRTRRAGGVERSPPGDGVLGPRERIGSPGREEFPTFSEGFPPWN